MAKDRMDAGRGRSGQQVKKPGAQGAPGGKKVAVRSTDRRPFYLILGAIALAAVVFIGWQMSQSRSSGVITVDPSITLPEATGYLIGSATAPVEILEFADFECPACGSFATLTEPDVRKRPMEHAGHEATEVGAQADRAGSAATRERVAVGGVLRLPEVQAQHRRHAAR